MKEKQWAILILVLAAAVRLYGLTGFSLSNDELSALARLQYNSFGEVIQEGVYTDYHPAGVQLFLYWWTSLFGFGEWIVRLPFALMGVVAVYIMYRLGKDWFGMAAGLCGAAVLALSEFPLLYSQIARPYSPGLLFTLSAAWVWTRYFGLPLDNKQKWQHMILFSLLVSLCMYTHYFSFIFAGLLCLSGIFLLRKELIIPYVTAGILIVIYYLPHLGIFEHQLGKGGVGGAAGWLGPPDSSTFGKYILYIFNDNVTLRNLFVVILIGSFLVYRKQAGFTKYHLLALLFFIVPFAIAYYYSIYRNPVLQYSVLLFSYPYLILFCFSFLPRNLGRTSASFFVVITLLSVGWSSFANDNYYNKSHFSEFRGIANRIDELEQRLGSDKLSVVVNIHHPYYLNYYFERMGRIPEIGLYRISNDEELEQFNTYIDSVSTPYFLFAFSNMYDDLRYDMMIRNKYPYLIEHDSLFNSGLRLYTNTQSSDAINAQPIFSYTTDFSKGDWDHELEQRDSIVVKEGRYSIRQDADKEWGPSFNLPLNSPALQSAKRIEIKCSNYFPQPPVGALLVMVIEKNGENLIWKSTDLAVANRHFGKWNNSYLVADIDVPIEGTEVLKIYCWNLKKELFYLDAVSLNIY